MTGRTECITELEWADLLLFWYVLVDDAYQVLEKRHGKWRRRGPLPRFSDSEVIVVGMMCDAFFGGKEEQGLHCVRQHYRHFFPRLPSNGHFNERRTILGPLMEQVRQEISAWEQLIDPEDTRRIIDSAPIALCTYQRGGECQSFDPAFAQHDFAGYSVKDKAKFMGYRLVATVTQEQEIDQWMLAPASFHDSVTLGGMLADAHGLCFLADGAYHNPALEQIARTKRNTTVLAPPRHDSRTTVWSDAYRALVARLRRNIESVFGTLTTAFHLQRPGSRSLKGFVCRTSSQILAYTLCSICTRQLQAGLLF